MQKASNYRYTLTDRLGNIVAYPLGESDFSIEWSRDTDQGKRTYKKDFGGKIVFTGEAFARLHRMEKTIYRCDYQRVTIDKKCVFNGVSSWSLWFDGLISLNEGNWDEDRCRVEIKFQENKPEQCFEENKSEKINLFQETFQRRSVNMLPGNVEIQKKISIKNIGSESGGYYGGYYWDGVGTPEDGAWTAYEHSESDDGIHHRISTSWVRQIMVLDCNFILSGGDGGWILVDNTCYTDPNTGLSTGSKTYARPATVYGCETNGGDVTNSEYTMTCKIFGETSTNTTFDNGIPLDAVIGAFVIRFCPGVTVKSDFFQINPEVVSNINYVTKKSTKTKYITLFQKSDIKRPSAAANASKMEWSWDKLMSTLKIMFDVEWRIENNKLVIEHSSFFKRGVGLNLTLSKYERNVKGKRKYSYTNDSIPKQEVWKWKEQVNSGDFPGLPIVYSNGCVSLSGRDTVLTYAVEDVMTDVEYAISNPAPDSPNVSDDGIVFIAAQGGGDSFSIITEAGILEKTKINNSLAFAQLMRDYHRYNRPLKNGRLNGFETEFLSVIPTKKGETLSIPLCCGDNFDPDDAIITPLGTGIVDKAKFNFMTSTLELDLLYEANTGLMENTPPIATNDVLETDKDAAISFNVLSNDVDEPGDIITKINIVLQPQHGTLTILPDYSMSYLPNSGYVGDDYFIYNYEDSWHERSNNALVAITVKGVFTVPAEQKKTVWVKLLRSAVTTKNVTITCNGAPQAGGSEGTANYTFYFYQDQAGTIPLDVSGYGLVLQVSLDTDSVYDNADSHQDTTVEVPGGVTYTWQYNYLVSQNLKACDGSRILKNSTITLNPGKGYTLVGQVPIPDTALVPVKLASPLTGSLRNLPISWGTAVKDDKFNDQPYGSILQAEYDEFTGENSGKFGHIQGTEGVWDFTDMDRLFEWALANGRRVFWHTAVWADKMPGWFDTKIATLTEAQVLAILGTHIDKVLDRYMIPKYEGILVGCDVANEPFADNGTHKNTVLYQRAPNYISYCVKRVNTKAPNLLTFINDYGQEYGSAAKTNALIALKSQCAAIGARLDGIGFQMHTVGFIDVALFYSRMQLVANAGLLVHISEFDMRVENGTTTGVRVDQGPFPFMTPALEQEQARVTLEIVNAFLALPADRRYGFKTWCLSDADSNINLEDGAPEDYPGLRDFNYRPKPNLLKLESRAMELKNFLIYDNYRTGVRSTMVGATTNGGQVTKTYAVSGSGTGFGGAEVTLKGLVAKSTTNTNFTFVTLDVGSPNFIMIFGLSDLLGGSASFNANKNIMPVFRWQNSTNFWYFRPIGSTTTNYWSLRKKVSDQDTTIFNDTAAANVNDVAAILVQGNVITCYINGRMVGTVTDAQFNIQTKAGFRFRGNLDTVSAVDFLAIGTV